MTISEQQRVFPPEFPVGREAETHARLEPALHSAWRISAKYRQDFTRYNPLLFAVTYLNREGARYLSDDVTGRVSFAEHHLEMTERARYWVRPESSVDAWVLPRGGAKTTWLFLACPLWALAHGHRKFALFFSLTADQAEFHLRKLRDELRDNALLLHDFPHLRPQRGANTKHTVLTGGAAFAARGLGGSTLGLTSGAHRPDLLIGDDLEPDSAKHTPARKDDIVRQVTEGIIPMGARHAVTVLAGTTTMAGSMMHDVVKAARGESVASWIAAHRVRPHYWPAILDEGAPAERSLWPQRWSLAELKRMRDGDPVTGEGADPQGWALNYANRPELATVQGYWQSKHIRYDPRREIVRRVLAVDVAVSQGARSDQTAIVLAGLTRDGRTVAIEHAEAGRITGLELRERLWEITQAGPGTIKEWIIESNQGGERWREIVAPLPPGVRLDLEHVSGSKRSRIELALKHYQRGAVVHAVPLPQLEEQMLAWTPRATADDLLDALAGALRRLFPAALA